MRAVLLCAGFGTRLYPLTKNQPKALLSIAGVPLLNYLVKKLEMLEELTHTVLVSNASFYPHFSKWKETLRTRLELSIVNDGTIDNDHRLGAIRDLKLAIDHGSADDDFFVLAGDNLLDSGLEAFVSFAKSKKPAPSVGVYRISDRVLAQQYGLIKTDSSGKITDFFEKPKDPPSLLASIGAYFFPKETIQLMNRYLEDHQNPDAPGYYISWL